MTFGLLFSVIISDKRIFTDSGKTLVEYFAQYLAEYAFKVPKTCTNIICLAKKSCRTQTIDRTATKI